MDRILLLFIGVIVLSGFTAGQPDQRNSTRNWEVKNDPKKQIALIIGNSLYEHNGQLLEPANDAQIIASALREQGAVVMVAYNLDLETLEKTFREFSRRFREYEEAIVYYAGHGFQINGKNYLVPIDANPKSTKDVPSSCIDLSYVLSLINDGEKPKLIILDACRNNPFSRNWVVQSRSTTGGLKEMPPDRNALMAFSTSEGSEVYDDNPFAEALAEEIREGVCSYDLLPNAFRKVEAINPDQQINWKSKLLDHICFGKAASPLVTPQDQLQEVRLPAREPDEDQDGVPDIDDRCPNVKGYPSLRGCPLEDLDQWQRRMNAYGLPAEAYDREIAQLSAIDLPIAAAARAGYLLSAGKGSTPDRARGQQLIKDAAQKADPFGQYLLGRLYLSDDGLGLNYSSANWWLEKAARQGHTAAQFLLAKHLEKGQGGSPDLKAAFSWMEKAAVDGYLPAQNELGNYYFDGKGTEQDLPTAVIYYRKAANSGLNLAQVNMGNCYLMGKGVQQNLDQATAWYEKASNNGDASGLYNLAISYLGGGFAPRSDEKGVALLKRAARAGYQPARQELINLDISW